MHPPAGWLKIGFESSYKIGTKPHQAKNLHCSLAAQERVVCHGVHPQPAPRHHVQHPQASLPLPGHLARLHRRAAAHQIHRPRRLLRLHHPQGQRPGHRLEARRQHPRPRRVRVGALRQGQGVAPGGAVGAGARRPHAARARGLEAARAQDAEGRLPGALLLLRKKQGD